jgi:hypothetical protein
VLKNDNQQPSLFTGPGIFASLVIQLSRLTAYVNGLGELRQVSFGHCLQAHGFPPAVYVFQVVPHEPWQGYHAYVRLLSILALDPKGRHSHLAQGSFLPPRW